MYERRPKHRNPDLAWRRAASACATLAACGLLALSPTGCSDDAETTSEGQGADRATDQGVVAGGDGSGSQQASTEPDAEEQTQAPDGEESRPGIPWTGSLAAERSCAATGNACAAGDADTAVYASYRKDAYLDLDLYPEASLDFNPPVPLDGGRFHVVGVATRSGPVTRVKLDGVALRDLVDPDFASPRLEWYHVWPDPVVAGEPVWVSFHSRDAAWDSAATGQIEVETAAGKALDASFPVAITEAPITYFGYSEDLSELYVHVRNDGDAPVELKRLLVDGQDVLASGAACISGATLVPGETAMWTVPRCAPAELGEAWTVVADWEGTADAVAGGRFLRPLFPIETWPDGDDCPIPGGDEALLQRHFDAGFDTFYLYWRKDCSMYSSQEVLAEYAQLQSSEYNVLIGDDFVDLLDEGKGEGLIPDTSHVAGLLTGDESDGEVYDENGAPNPEEKARSARQMWRLYPDITVYNGAKTHKNVGTFAGMTDVQGNDLYVAACAPWITGLTPPPLRASYDYLRNTRNNHMPWPTWQYSQGLEEWKGDPPDRAEILIQAFSAMAAGAKGLMWFQTVEEIADRFPESWNAMSQSNWVFRAVRERLRTGDLTDAARSEGEVITELVRSTDALIVPIISLANNGGPDLASCGLADILGDVPHWDFATQTVDLSLDVPADFAVVDAFEILVDDTAAEQVVDLAYEGRVDGRTLTLQGLPLDEQTPVRLLVLASDPGVRADMANRLAH